MKSTSSLIFRKGKYKSSLYHLELSQRLENDYLEHKYDGKIMPSSALEKLSTTYSNLSAILSKLGNLKEALKNIEFAIEIIQKDETLTNHPRFIELYYNYSILL